MPYNLPATRLLMNRLRQIMAEEGDAQARLNHVVQMIASTMVADVCSIYLSTVSDQHLLIATQGLNAEAVATTRLSNSEGLVGLVATQAKPISIQDAPRHPAFSYRPETGEDPFHAFLGVPILRGGRVVGVLTVQNRTERAYAEDEIDILQTIAMVLAEIVDRIDPDEMGQGTGKMRERRQVSLAGRVLCDGLGYGQAVLHDPVVPSAKFFAMDQLAETNRLSEGLEVLKASIDQMMTIDGMMLGDDPRDVLETYRMMAQDPSWAEKLHEGVRSGLTAEASVDRARREHRARLQSAKDQYLRERLFDLEDLDNRLLRILGGDEGRPVIAGERNVLVARRLGPAELLEYSGSGLRAVLMEEAASSSHAAIVARALGIPTLGGVSGLTTRIDEGDWIIVDAEGGTLHIRPDNNLYDAYKARVALRSERQAAYAALKDMPARTRDGADVSLMMNAGLGLDMDMLDQTGADGVGLFRTEFQFLVSETIPKIGDQVDAYKFVLERAGERPVVFRTLDLGGDKVLPALGTMREENPALGWRSIRFALDHVGLFRRQLRALVRAAGEGPLTVMFPMVTTPGEFHQAHDLLMREVEWSEQQTGKSLARLKVGVMLETPALAFSLQELDGKAEFLSVGTNDLMQFFFAADRMTPSVSERYDLISPSAIRFLKQVAESCEVLGIETSMCGEATASPLAALCFVTLGFHQLSMPAAGIGPVKQMIRSLDISALKPDFFALLENPGADFRNDLLALTMKHRIAMLDG